MTYEQLDDENLSLTVLDGGVPLRVFVEGPVYTSLTDTGHHWMVHRAHFGWGISHAGNGWAMPCGNAPTLASAIEWLDRMGSTWEGGLPALAEAFDAEVSRSDRWTHWPPTPTNMSDEIIALATACRTW